MARAAGSKTAETTLDGRARRGARNRERIVEALLALVGEGELLPTAEQVSERARVGTRTVFRHFADMESLYAEMHANIEQELKPFLEEPPAEGSRDERARALVARRAVLFERIAPFKRSGNLQRWRSAFLRRSHAVMVRHLRRDLLRSLPDVEGSAAWILDALDLATSFDAWERLRGDQHLGRERAQAAMLATVEAILAQR